MDQWTRDEQSKEKGNLRIERDKMVDLRKQQNEITNAATCTLTYCTCKQKTVMLAKSVAQHTTDPKPPNAKELRREKRTALPGFGAISCATASPAKKIAPLKNRKGALKKGPFDDLDRKRSQKLPKTLT